MIACRARGGGCSTLRHQYSPPPHDLGTVVIKATEPCGDDGTARNKASRAGDSSNERYSLPREPVTHPRSGLHPLSAGLSCWPFAEAWNNFRLLTRGQWPEAEIVAVRTRTATTTPASIPRSPSPSESEEVRFESKADRLCPIDRSTPIRVRYNPAKPQRARPEGYRGPALFTCIASGAAGAFVAVAVFLDVLT